MGWIGQNTCLERNTPKYMSWYCKEDSAIFIQEIKLFQATELVDFQNTAETVKGATQWVFFPLSLGHSQKGLVICPKTYSWLVTKLQLSSRASNLQSRAFRCASLLNRLSPFLPPVWSIMGQVWNFCIFFFFLELQKHWSRGRILPNAPANSHQE